MKKVDLAYIAGITDADGYIGIKKTKPGKTGRIFPGYHERIQIRMVEESAIRFIAENLGGWYYKEKPSATKGKPLFCYQANDLAAAKILYVLLPFLRIKKEQAKNALLLRENKKSPRAKIMVKHPITQRFRFSPETVAYREKLWQQCRNLNKVGI